MSTTPQPAANSISHNQVICRQNPESKAQIQTSQQSTPPHNGEINAKKRKRRRSRKPRVSVSATMDSSTPVAASIGVVPLASGQEVNLPAARKTRPGKRPQTLPHAPAAMVSEPINVSAPPVPTVPATVPKGEARGRDLPKRPNAAAAVAGGVPQAPSSRSHVSRGVPSAAHLLLRPINHHQNPVTTEHLLKNETESVVSVTPEEEAARKQEQRRLQKAKKRENHLNLVFSAANATIAALNKHGLSCVTFGSLACKLYGAFRDPKDVDVLILQPPDTPLRTAEQVKILIVDTDPRHFFLKLPRDPTAQYRKLYYRSDTLRGSCKVDILIPGTMYLPDFPLPSSHKHITTISGIPLVPFSLLLLHKLQGWSDHINAPEPHKQRRHVQDAADIRRLLAMKTRLNDVRRTQPWRDSELFCEEFQQLTRERVKKFCEAFQDSVATWQLLGFETYSEASSDPAAPC